ncbi:MAG: hypothetical protein JWO19_4472 [Bryobacterales bacterium]|nr:hypothetical protein [Bryobacterales bacterium]
MSDLSREALKKLTTDEILDRLAGIPPGSVTHDLLQGELKIRLRNEGLAETSSTRKIAIAALFVGMLNALATAWPYFAPWLRGLIGKH